MSNNNSFGGKLRKVLASMCSLFVGASGVSQAAGPGTSMPNELGFSECASIFGFGNVGWKLVSGDAKKENSWLGRESEMRIQPLGINDEISFQTGFAVVDTSCRFCICTQTTFSVDVTIPKGILFDVMRHFESKYFPNDDNARNKGTKLSCTKGKLNADDEVFLRFILWAFCGSDNAIKPEYNYNAGELKEDILKFAINTYNPNNARSEFVVKSVQGIDSKNGKKVEKKYSVLKPGYFLRNFYNRVCEVYKEVFGYDVTDMDDVVNFIAQLNNAKATLSTQIDQLNKDNKELNVRITELNEEKENLKNQKHIGKYLLGGALGGLTVGGALVEGAHRFLGAKRSRSSEVNKNKISSNGKNDQKAKNNLKK